MKPAGRRWTTVRDLFTGAPGDEGRPAPAPVRASETAEEDYLARLGANLMRRPLRLVVACLATVLGPAVVAQAGSLGAQPVAEAEPAGEEPVTTTPPRAAPGDPRSWMVVARQAAATCPGLPAPVLLAIGQVESDLGLDTRTSSAGAVGPMQFMPATWDAYGVDGDGDGRADVTNAVDALHGAARLLCANGGAEPHRLGSAVWNYNRSDDYVRRVMGLSHLLRMEGRAPR